MNETPRFFPAPGMARALASEIADHLAAAATPGAAPAIIDLRSLPLTPDDMAELEALLGTGEVEATLTVSGRSDLRETAYAGVWWVRHFDADGAPQSAQIVIAAIPDILCADPADMRHAATRLGEALGTEIAPVKGETHARA